MLIAMLFKKKSNLLKKANSLVSHKKARYFCGMAQLHFNSGSFIVTEGDRNIK
ncbi:hypothetical protein SAMN03080601_02073 [Alkalitalea saponilacus]|uniref:Uncharacterized protein n=1 Tax=Alkalitalea saponilacus TaxID=889453 RepID=A0A1T5H3X0_9BACT|nr:hypothetical protein SAMN03080601_02073 [Alkalitalea saponilacus]